jgi:hypothetical protein
VNRLASVLIAVVVFSCVAAGAARPLRDPAPVQATKATPPAAPAITPGANADAVARAGAAMQALQAALIGRLREEIARGGPPAAITVCRDEALVITAAVAREQGVAMGRTSDRLRNPANAPPAWARATVSSNAGQRVADVQPVTVDLGDRIGVLRPIGTVDMCTNCHGSAASIAPAVREVLAHAYPDDKATGFSTGDLRGWMWAEVPKDAR